MPKSTSDASIPTQCRSVNITIKRQYHRQMKGKLINLSVDSSASISDTTPDHMNADFSRECSRPNTYVFTPQQRQ